MAFMQKAWRNLCSPRHCFVPQIRKMSSGGPLQVTVCDEKRGIGEICLQKPPVNSLDRVMLAGIYEGVTKLEKDGCRGLLVTSDVPGVFSAGLNLPDLYGQSKSDLVQYWGMVQEMFLRLYNSSMVTVACITGSAPAGGCLVSTSCDYRLMVDKPKIAIGLNESQIGMPVPDWMRMNLVDVVGRRQADLALQMGVLFSPQRALAVGLVDELAETPAELRQAALRKLELFLKVTDVGRVPSKRMATEPLVSYLSGRRDKDADVFASGIVQDHVQKAMGKYLEALRNKSAK